MREKKKHHQNPKRLSAWNVKQTLSERKEDWVWVFELQTVTNSTDFLHTVMVLFSENTGHLFSEVNFRIWKLRRKVYWFFISERNSETNQGEVTKLIRGQTISAKYSNFLQPLKEHTATSLCFSVSTVGGFCHANYLANYRGMKSYLVVIYHEQRNELNLYRFCQI